MSGRFLMTINGEVVATNVETERTFSRTEQMCMKVPAVNVQKRSARSVEDAGERCALIESEMTLVGGITETRTASEPQFETGVRRRAETITVVLSEILSQRQGVQHWGLND
jgi:hypothetical protein